MSEPINRSFVQKFWPACVKVSGETGIPAMLLICVSAYETGWGEDSTVLENGATNNYFGLKSNVGANLKRATGKALVPTSEFDESGRPKQPDYFGVYRSYEDAARDFCDWITGKNGLEQYEGMKIGSVSAMAQQLESIGYSTEKAGMKDEDGSITPGYAARIRGIAARITEQAADIIGAKAASTPTKLPVTGKVDNKGVLKTLRALMEAFEKDPLYAPGTDLYENVVKPVRQARDYLKG